VTEGTSRIDAFSDGVFAIAITLLVLEIRLPHAGAHGGLLAGLLALWPYYFAFTLSFFVILVSWMTHHDLMRLVRATNHPIQLANGCVLAYIAFLPFPTAVLASHLGGTDVATAVTFYCGTFVFGNIAFNLLFETMARSQLLRPSVDAGAIRARSSLSRPASSACSTVKNTITSNGPVPGSTGPGSTAPAAPAAGAPASTRAPSGSGSSSAPNPSGAPASPTRAPGLMPSFLGSGVPE